MRGNHFFPVRFAGFFLSLILIVSTLPVNCLAFSQNLDQTKILAGQFLALSLAQLPAEDYILLEKQLKEGKKPIAILSDKEIFELLKLDKNSEKDRKTIALVQTKAMFTIGETSRFPVFVRLDSSFMKGAMKDFQSETVPLEQKVLGVIKATALFSHELWHISSNKTDDEVGAIQRERQVYSELLEQHSWLLQLNGALAKEAKAYGSFLEEQQKQATSQLVASK